MSLSTLTDTQIQALIACPKRVENPNSREHTDGKHIRRDHKVVSADGVHAFVLFRRQSTLIADSFSAGLRWRGRSGEEVILLRCNGADHPHANALERGRFPAQQHIHRATERYILVGRKAECYAEPTTLYSTLEGAIRELTRIANISGLATQPDEPDFFKQS